MITRRIGGIDVSALALGGANFGGLGSARRLIGQGESETEARALLDCALALGITLIDTAGSYADGASETMIGRWLGTRAPEDRARVRLSSKVGLRGGLGADTMAREVERSLARLGVETLDFYLAHVPDPNTPWPEVMATMGHLKARGLIRAFGLSNVGIGDIEACMAGPDDAARPVLIQNRFNLLDQADDGAGVVAACRAAGLAYTAYSPLAGGLLGGQYTYAPTLPEGTRLALRPDLYAHLWTQRTSARVDALKTIAEAAGLSLPGLAVWWLIHHGGVAAVMLGARTPRQLERLVREAIETRFDAALFEATTIAAGSTP